MQDLGGKSFVASGNCTIPTIILVDRRIQNNKEKTTKQRKSQNRSGEPGENRRDSDITIEDLLFVVGGDDFL